MILGFIGFWCLSNSEFVAGAIFYQIGAVVAYLEAVNDGSFHGSAMRKLMDGHDEEQKKMMDEK